MEKHEGKQGCLFALPQPNTEHRSLEEGARTEGPRARGPGPAFGRVTRIAPSPHHPEEWWQEKLRHQEALQPGTEIANPSVTLLPELRRDSQSYK